MTRRTPESMPHQETPIPYELVYTRRKTLAIYLYPDGRTVVRAPHGSTPAQIAAFVAERAAWVTRKQRERTAHLASTPMTRAYMDGEAFAYLGESSVLTLVSSPRERVDVSGGRMTVQVRSLSDTAHIAHLIDGWYQVQAERVFQERLAVWIERVAAVGIAPPGRMTIRLMKTRWGSCSSRRRVTLNLRLITMPLAIIDYVIAHELCHLREMNHSRRYYALLDHVLPGWKVQRIWLRQQTAIGVWP